MPNLRFERMHDDFAGARVSQHARESAGLRRVVVGRRGRVRADEVDVRAAGFVERRAGGARQTVSLSMRRRDVNGVGGRADDVVAALERRLQAVRSAVAGLERPRAFALEWSDPPFNGGHWVPEMIEAAGGTPVLANAGASSVRVAWEDIVGAAPEVVVFMPCGYDLAAAVDEARRTLLGRAELPGGLVVVHADAYFSRPGPRLVDGVEALAAALHAGAVPEPPDGAFMRLR